jgi:putative sterol carrier protein
VRALVLDEDRVRMLKEAKGSLAIKLTSAAGEHQLLLTLGKDASSGPADCELACALEDLWALQSGAKNPFELLMDGKVKMTGNVQLAMVLGAALG